MNFQLAAVYLGFLGLFAFLLGAAILGVWLRKNPTKENAEKSSRVVHFLFFAGLGVPIWIAFFFPGLRHLDGLVGLNPLPFQPFFLAAGILLALPGLYLMAVSNKSLRALGSGANAFRLTQRIVEKDIYRYTRNPMSLGYYLIGLSLAFLSGSTLLTLYVLVGIIPAHLFTLKFFEELELKLRFGESYQQYKQKVAFLIPRRSTNADSNTVQL
jgi:protein-S-isoprenylcysteine O-methyltransferase Ste14